MGRQTRQLVATECAGRTAIGFATARTPLLDQPLSGSVYAVSGSGGLPRLAFILNGQVKILPRADTVTAGGGRLKTTVPVIPDAAVGHFTFDLFGGKNGYLVYTRAICANRPLARVGYTAQNGKARSEAVRVKSPCGGKKGSGKRRDKVR